MRIEKSKLWMSLAPAIVMSGGFSAAAQAVDQASEGVAISAPVHSRVTRAMRARARHGGRSNQASRMALLNASSGAHYALPRASFDTSGNAALSGPYFVRQILVLTDTTTSTVTRAASLLGIMTFDGNGNYSFTGQLLDSTV